MSLFGDLKIAYSRGDQFFKREMRKVGLTKPQYLILELVDKHPGISQIGVSEATKIDRSTTAEVVVRLMGKGWLYRVRPDDNARTYELRLTHDGETVLSEARQLAATAETKLLQKTGKPKAIKSAIQALIAATI